MQNFPRNALFLATLLACGSAAYADDAKPADPAAAAKPAGPTLSDILTNSGVDLKGYIDVAAEAATTSTGGNGYKVFDTEHTGLGVHQLGLTVDKLPKEGFGGLVNVTAGKDAKVIVSNGEANSNEFNLTQTFVQYAHGATTVQLGKFTTLAGAEVIDSSANTNFSRSILFGAIPFTHTGGRVTYALSDTSNAIVGINNGWDQVTDYNTQKTIELGLTGNPLKPLTLAGAVYSGVEPGPASSATSGTRTLFDLVATYTVTDKLTLIGNFDYATQENVTVGSGTKSVSYDGLAVYANYQIDDNNRISARAEYLDDKDGAKTGTLGTSQKAKEFTFTYGYSPAKNFELRTELRYDKADNSIFTKPDSSQPGGLASTDNGTTFALQGVYKF